MSHLRREGLALRACLVGDVMTDVCFRVRDAVVAAGESPPVGLPTGGYLVATIHRAENTDDDLRLRAIIDALAAAPMPVLLVAHPRLIARCQTFGIPLHGTRSALVTIDPLSYPAMVNAVMQSAGVVTDSGGLQKEAFLLGRLCTTVRTETEWEETLEDGWNLLLDDLSTLGEAVQRPYPTAERGLPYGDGKAASRVVDALLA
jgi:UDP-N-acetylglucosamine 2-epimerase (non-hydrolysing)